MWKLIKTILKSLNLKNYLFKIAYNLIENWKYIAKHIDKNEWPISLFNIFYCWNKQSIESKNDRGIKKIEKFRIHKMMKLYFHSEDFWYNLKNSNPQSLLFYHPNKLQLVHPIKFEFF